MKSQMLIETVCVLAGASVRVHVSESTDVCRHTTRKLYTNAYLLLYRVGWGIAPMGGAKRAPLILANLELCGSIWRSNDSLQHTKDLSTDEYVLI